MEFRKRIFVREITGSIFGDFQVKPEKYSLGGGASSCARGAVQGALRGLEFPGPHRRVGRAHPPGAQPFSQIADLPHRPRGPRHLPPGRAAGRLRRRAGRRNQGQNQRCVRRGGSPARPGVHLLQRCDRERSDPGSGPVDPLQGVRYFRPPRPLHRHGSGSDAVNRADLFERQEGSGRLHRETWFFPWPSWSPTFPSA